MFSNINEAWGNESLKQLTDKIKNNSQKKVAENISHSAKSDDTDFISMTENALADKKKSAIKDRPQDSDLFDTSYSSNFNHSLNPTGFSFLNQPSIGIVQQPMPIKDDCSKIINHVNTCAKCKLKLDRIIKKKVKEECEDLLFENKLLKLQSPPNGTSAQSTSTISSLTGKSGMSDNFKETMIILVAAIVVVFIIFIIFRR
jgi:hypothetical protein